MSGVHFATEPNAYLEPKITKSGAGAQTAKTVIDVFRETVHKHGNQPALCYKRAPSKVNNKKFSSILVLMKCCLGSTT